ncbi:Protease, Ulp1 family [Pseudoloma neurophilia]|uniref:Protease, Ulp1 family n=1 Tax=Pseudoloma neurophilia TaxID=146866 RepID=A0A0R0M441_9MICR|nr:Protease, Ulp1 family [Pseudoloma neurophilia]
MASNLETSFFRLLSKDWFDDVIIDKYLELVTIYGVSIGKKSIAFSTHILDLCNDHGYDKYISHYKTAVEEAELLFLPLNVPGHWVLYIYVRELNVLEFYDSGGGETRKLSALSNFLKQFNIIKYQLDKREVFYQQDSFNCGLFVCIFVRYKINYGDCRKILSKNLKIERYKVLMELSIGKILFLL